MKKRKTLDGVTYFILDKRDKSLQWELTESAVSYWERPAAKEKQTRLTDEGT